MWQECRNPRLEQVSDLNIPCHNKKIRVSVNVRGKVRDRCQNDVSKYPVATGHFDTSFWATGHFDTSFWQRWLSDIFMTSRHRHYKRYVGAMRYCVMTSFGKERRILNHQK